MVTVGGPPTKTQKKN